DVAHQQAGDGDAELRTREHERGALGDVEGTRGGGVTSLRAGGQAGSVHRHVRELLGYEVAGHSGDDQDHEDPDQQTHYPGHRARPRARRTLVTAWVSVLQSSSIVLQ